MSDFQSATELHKDFNNWTISDNGGQSIQIGKGNLIIKKDDIPEFIKTLQYFYDNRIIEIYCGQKYIIKQNLVIDNVRNLAICLSANLEVLVTSHDNGSVHLEHNMHGFKETSIVSRQQFCDYVRKEKIVYLKGGIR